MSAKDVDKVVALTEGYSCRCCIFDARLLLRIKNLLILVISRIWRRMLRLPQWVLFNFKSLNDWRKSSVNQDKMEINSMDSKVRELNTAQLATVRPQDVRMLSLQDFLRLETVLVLNLLTFVIYIADQVRECEKVFLLNHCSPTRSGTKPSGTSLSPFWSLPQLGLFHQGLLRIITRREGSEKSLNGVYIGVIQEIEQNLEIEVMC